MAILHRRNWKRRLGEGDAMRAFLGNNWLAAFDLDFL
jgi:hypothetical protein